MFPRRFFCADYFAPRYFPQSQGSAPVSPNLRHIALSARAPSNPALAARAPGASGLPARAPGASLPASED